METIALTIWGILVFGFCALGVFLIIRNIHNLPDYDDETKRRIAEGEIDNFSEDPTEIYKQAYNYPPHN